MLPYVVLKIFAFQDRHQNKDAYDLSFTLMNYPGGPYTAGREAASSAAIDHRHVTEAVVLLEERFRDPRQDGPNGYATFLANLDDEEEKARLRQEAVAVVRQFIRGIRER